MSTIISFVNNKDGVGKTTVAFNVGAGIADAGEKKVLFIDLDPQASLTYWALPSSAIPEYTISEVFSDFFSDESGDKKTLEQSIVILASIPASHRLRQNLKQFRLILPSDIPPLSL